MNEMQIFNNPNFGTVRAVEIDGEPWLVGKDVAAALGYSNSRKALADHVDEEDKGVTKCDTLGGAQDMTIINESGVYSLVFGSKLETAKQFKHWVTSEVLPSIRKHGAYMTPATLENMIASPDFGIQLLTALKQEREQKAALQQANDALTAKIEADAPKVLYADTVAGAKGGMLIREFCKFLREKGVNIGEKRMFADLRQRGFLIKAEGRDKNKPTQRSMEMGLFSIKETAVAKPSGETVTVTTPLLTGKGRQYFAKVYLTKEASQ